jgi:hypothetical protein
MKTPFILSFKSTESVLSHKEITHSHFFSQAKLSGASKSQLEKRISQLEAAEANMSEDLSRTMGLLEEVGY